MRCWDDVHVGCEVAHVDGNGACVMRFKPILCSHFTHLRTCALRAVHDEQDVLGAKQFRDLLDRQADTSCCGHVRQANDACARCECGGNGGQERMGCGPVHGDGKVVDGEEAEARVMEKSASVVIGQEKNRLKKWCGSSGMTLRALPKPAAQTCPPCAPGRTAAPAQDVTNTLREGSDVRRLQGAGSR